MVSRGRIHAIDIFSSCNCLLSSLSLLSQVSSELQGVLSSNVAKREALKDSLASQIKKNDIINLHLQHTLASAGLSKDESAEITTNIGELVNQRNKEIDQLTMMIAREKEEYNNHRSMLIKRGVSVEDIVS